MKQKKNQMVANHITAGVHSHITIVPKNHYHPSTDTALKLKETITVTKTLLTELLSVCVLLWANYTVLHSVFESKTPLWYFRRQKKTNENI